MQNNVQGTVENVIAKNNEQMSMDNLLNWLNEETHDIWKEDKNNKNNKGYPIFYWQ